MYPNLLKPSPCINFRDQKMDLVTTVESVSGRPDGTVVTIGLPDAGLMPDQVQVVRARGRAMIEAGVVNVAGQSSRQVAGAIRNLSFSQIQRTTEVLSKSEDEVEILVRT